MREFECLERISERPILADIARRVQLHSSSQGIAENSLQDDVECQPCFRNGGSESGVR